MADDLRSQLATVLRALQREQASLIVDPIAALRFNRLRDLIEAYRAEGAKDMRERCAEAIEATTESGSPALRQWAAEIVRAVPVKDGE